MLSARCQEDLVVVCHVRILRNDAVVVVDSAVRRDQLIRHSVPRQQLASRSLEEVEVRVRGVDDAAVEVGGEEEEVVPLLVRDHIERNLVLCDEAKDPAGRKHEGKTPSAVGHGLRAAVGVGEIHFG